jgi:hypothetical protein
MKNLLATAALLGALASPALAQSTTSPLPAPRAPVDTAAPLPGANSFTEMQARQRAEEAGFSNVTGLVKDDQGIWRGSAMRAGAQQQIAIDYRGNVFPK